jgi:hypothetical protein
MSQAAIESFLGRVITDKKFRQLALVSPEYACSSAGLELSSLEKVSLQALDLTLLDGMVGAIDCAIQRQ